MSQDKELLPLLPLRNAVLFPNMVINLVVGRGPSLASVETAAGREDRMLVVFCQKDPTRDEPGQDDLFEVGTLGMIRRMTRVQETLHLVLQGIRKVRLKEVSDVGAGLFAWVEPLAGALDDGPEVEALHREVLETAGKLLNLASGQELDLSQLSLKTGDPLDAVYFLASVLSLDVSKEQALLEAGSRAEALRLMYGYLSYELQISELRHKIVSQAKSEITEDQKKYVLRQQLRAIQHELGEDADSEAEIDLLREKLEHAELPEDVRRETERELNRLARLPRTVPDYQVSRSYLDLVLELPWNRLTEDRHDLRNAREVLDEDHFDLEEVKSRILEHLAVMKLRPESRAPILCFVGPPGTGKTSLGQSIARALDRKFERMSLGGLHDESELRGHRRTYVGAMPGRILQALRRAGSRNPVLMLDELDKVGRESFHGDPSAALMEILDPAQNQAFRDNYLDLPFDLSRVFFITTANTLETIHRPLLDRMEVLHLSGYTMEEKLKIARLYLLPRQVRESGLGPEDLVLSDEVLRAIVETWTREAGVRQLERALGRLARKLALRVASEEASGPFTVAAAELPELLGTEIHRPERTRQALEPGVAPGLAWTETGGDVLYIEATVMPGGSELTMTGHLGEVMKESGQAALTFVRSRAPQLGIPERVAHDSRVHLHVPAGAVPKDGPSAGIAMAVALATALTGTSARSDTALTGEVTLTGLVLPVGGIKEKVLAADRAGIRRVILPQDNSKNLRDLPKEVMERLEIVLVGHLEEVFRETVPALAERLGQEAAPPSEDRTWILDSLPLEGS